MEESIILKTLSPFKCIEIKFLGYNFYLVFNLLEEDRLRLLTARPWKLGDFSLLLLSGIPNFSIKEKGEERIAAV